MTFKGNSLYFGDCLDVMREDIPDQSVDLIYLDPPFNSKRLYNAFIGDAQWVAFNDTWQWHEAVEDFHQVAERVLLAPAMEGLRMILDEGPDLAYLSYMANRLIECHRALKRGGSIYLHCDPTMAHYLRVVMNAIFGKHNFRDQIVWRRNESGSKGSQHAPRRWGNNTDLLLFYTKGHSTYFKPRIAQLGEGELRHRFPKVDDNGERYNTKLTAWRQPSMGDRPNLCYPFLGLHPPYSSGWRLSKDRMQEEYEKGNIVRRGGKLERRSYAKDYKGVSPGNLWTDVDLLLPAQSKERLGYPTQKPVALLERILKASCPPDGVVLDPFCGCGTTLHAAQNLGLRWVGIDICVKACQIIEKRLRSSFDALWDDVRFVGMPKTRDDAKTLADYDPFRFERWAASLVDGMEYNKIQTGDKGIDGRGRLAIRKGQFVDLVSQVKGGHTSPGDVQAFNGARQQANADLGFFTCFEERVTIGMRNAAASTGRFMKTPVVQIYTVEDFFTGLKPEMPVPA